MPTNVVCISPECETLLPPGKTKYCSKTCYYRESKRKARYKAHMKYGEKYIENI